MDAILVEVTRGALVESRHVGAAVVVDAKGRVVFGAGDHAEAVFPRSAVKALLALPLVETGAADRLGLSDEELALTCSSHSGQPEHTNTAGSMLHKAGRDASCLECGAHWPKYEPSAHRLVREGVQPSALHNNCSGKHAGFICLACDQGIDPKDYVQPDHAAMRQVTAALAETTSTRLDAGNRAIDGCSIPTFAIPLQALALAFARFGCGVGLSADRAAAALRLRRAVAAHPFMVAGTDRFDTRLMGALGTRVFSKTGAEGVFCAALPELGLGLAVKCRDGAGRAAEVATAALIDRFLKPQLPEFTALLRPELRNWNGIKVGELRPAGALLA
jgi:L-asparaginase II